MWELLQKLEKLGWKPYGKSIAELTETEKNIRLLTSRSSGLWQFVCENGMIGDEKLKHNWVSQVERGLDVDCKRKVSPTKYEYRLIETALTDEDKLEQFLLDNIKVDE